jgi:ubiquinone/menaquinone biosynthesis C-methylase UbiE
VLEIGFGPGVALEDVLERARQGHVAGIDVSTVMVRQARRRNAEAIREGRLELREGSVARLPYPDGAFDKALAVNAVQAWPDTVGGLTEVRRVLRDGGLFVVTQEPHWARGDAEVERIRGRLFEQMRAAGFQQVRSEVRRLRPVLAFSILGTK